MYVNLALAALAVVTAVTAVPAAAPTSRTVYVTITDNKGQPVTDLTAADLVVKEDGKEREIAKAERATAKMRVALAVEELLVQDGSTRLAMFEFAKRLAGAAEISLITIGLSNRTLLNYTSDLNVLVDAINKLTLNPNRDSNVAEGVLELANRFAANRPERPVMVVLALSGGQAGVDPRSVLSKLGDSGATMHSVTLVAGGSAGPVGAMGDQSGREQILGDGPKQAGGRRIEVNVPAGLPKALQTVADDLLAQYAVTYVLPDGVKPSKRFNISSKRRGLTLRAPSVVPDR
jgi:hypothetical protein